MENEKTKTRQTFSDKWNQNKDLAFSETLREGSDIFNWILTRNGWKTPTALTQFLSDKKRILDAGCGNGRVTALLQKYAPGESEIVGIDLVAAEIAGKNLSYAGNVSTFTKDLLGDLGDLGKFDYIYCQEVLHHTAAPKDAFLNLCKLLAENGTIGIYVYKKKAPVREFVDDFIRDRISDLPYEEAMAACRQITELGKVLSEHSSDKTLKIPAVNLLEIPEGEYSVQRLFYHFFIKCFWNPDLSFEDNAVINYDWYHPQLCTRHTIEEIKGWFKDAGLSITQECVDFYGITVTGKK